MHNQAVELKPILIALVINLVFIFALPRVFVNPTGFKAFDDFVSYLKAQQAFLGFSSVLLAVIMYATSYYILNYGDEARGADHGELMTDDFVTPAPSSKSHQSHE
jgi:hypothetical protein